MVLGVGPNVYIGDLSQWESVDIQAALGFWLHKKERLNGQFLLIAGTTSGQNYQYSPEQGTPNRYFKSDLVGGQFEARYNFVKKNAWTIFLSQGLGFLRYQPKDELGEALIDNADTRAPGETYGTTTFMLPTSLGVNYLLANDFGLGMQLGFQNVMTDYLDNISQWGTRSGNDNLFFARLQFLIPLKGGKKEE